MIKLLVALGAEARPIIEYFRLRKNTSVSGFRLFQRDDTHLVISGSGRISMAAATAWLAAFVPDHQGVWLNIGTAGHGSLEVGSLFMACKVRELASGRCWYPPQILRKWPEMALSELLTVDQVQTTYEMIGYDMEASAFMATAQRFTTAEFVQSLKIVSDTPTVNVQDLKANDLSEYIAPHLHTLKNYIEDLQSLHKKTTSCVREAIEPFMSRWHFSVSQQHQLYELLRRWRALMEDQCVFNQLEFSGCSEAKQVLHKMNEALNDFIPRAVPVRQEVS